ncbi:MAG TPA: ribosome maturation factor RimM [Aeromicrobium sp.]|nr:ribosome maturation factor RimM [Aeromicrobium sp.]
MQVVVGRIGRAHGIRGELSVDVRTDEPDRRFAAGQQLTGGRRTFTVESSRHHQGRLLVRFAEVTDRTAAEQLTGTLLEVDIDPDEVPEDDEEFYDHQLVGLSAVADEREVGTVVDVLHLPEQDLLVIEVDGREVLVPFVAELVPEVDLAAGRLVVTDRPGLLDPDDAEVVENS